MDNEGFIKLADFGLAKIEQEEQINIKGMNEEDGKFLCGTAEYFSPEVVKEKDYGSHSDIWSFGILLYEMLTGNVS